jgi:hypothetical protein
MKQGISTFFFWSFFFFIGASVGITPLVSAQENEKILDISEENVQYLSIDDQGKDISIPFGYDAVGVLQTSLEDGIEFSVDNGKTWNVLGVDTDTGDDGRKDFASELFFLPTASDSFQFKILSRKNLQEDLKFYFINTQKSIDVFASNSSFSSAPYARDDVFFAEQKIVSREKWGANESFRYRTKPVPPSSGTSALSQRVIACQKMQTLHPEDFNSSHTVSEENNKKLKWPYKYSSEIKKIVVHHTAETGVSTGKSSEQVVNGIYSYHAKARGWGDIGYHFIIAPDGTIFEGRAGGDFVVGGHVYCSNTQTIGIALMGNFQTQSPGEDQLEALEKLIAGLSKKYNIDPSAESAFHGEFSPVVLGHRDLGSTACPGENLYQKLPTVRERVLSFLSQVLPNTALTPIQKDISAEFVGFVPFHSVFSGEKKHYTLHFKNTGTAPWDSSTWLFADLPSTDVSVLSADNKNAFYAAKLQEDSVLPGNIATFEVDIIGGFEEGMHTIEFSPVVHSRRVSSSSVVVPLEVKSSALNVSHQNVSAIVSSDKKNVNIAIDILNKGDFVFLHQDILLQVQVGNVIRFLKMNESQVGKNSVAHFSGVIPLEKNKSSVELSAILTKRGSKISGSEPITQTIVVDSSSSLPSSLPALSNVQWKAEVSGVQQKKVQTFAQYNTVPQKYFSIKNVGTQPWIKGKVYLRSSYKGNMQITQMQEERVDPGSTATFFLASHLPITQAQQFSLTLFYTDERNRKKRIEEGRFKWHVKPIQSQGNQINQEAVLEKIPENTSYFTPIQTTSASDTSYSEHSSFIPHNIRIRLGYTPEKNDIVTIAGNFEVWIDGKKRKNKRRFSIFAHNNGQDISSGSEDGQVFRFIPKNADPLIISSWNHAPAWNPALNDNMYRGVLEARMYNGQLIIINELPLEDYLKGLAEVSNDAPQEKKKAIAVIARSYAQFYMSDQNRKYPGAPYDGDDSPESFQKYLGYGYEKRSPLFSHAVDATAGEVVWYNGARVKTPFFSESAGRTFSAQEVWGWTHTPYLQSVSDTYCKNGNGTQKGHGVGLSGCGAEAMANIGKNYKEILNYYYSGIEVK